MKKKTFFMVQLILGYLVSCESAVSSSPQAPARHDTGYCCGPNGNYASSWCLTADKCSLCPPKKSGVFCRTTPITRCNPNSQNNCGS